MTEVQYVVLFVVAAVTAVTVLAVGTLGAADLLPERRRPLKAGRRSDPAPRSD